MVASRPDTAPTDNPIQEAWGSSSDGMQAPHLAIDSDWAIGELIGRGAHGSVHRALDKATGRGAAVKVMSLGANYEGLQALQREVTMLR